VIIKQTSIPGTSFQRRQYDDGTVLDRRNVYLTPQQWLNAKKLAMMHEISVSQVIGQVIDQAVVSAKHTLRG
jgi:hypothetical protein